MKSLIPIVILVLIFAGCIGTDVVDDPIVEERLEIFPDRIALLIGTSTTATAVFSNQYGIEEEVAISWRTEPSSIANVDANGVVSAVSPGQAKLFASYEDLIDSVRIAVVIDENAAASVDIEALKNSLSISESTMLSAVVKNIDDEVITSSTVEWFSSNDDIVTIDIDGVATGIANGVASVFAIVDGVYSNEIEFMVGSGVRMGTFFGANGYDASGTAILSESNGDIILMLNENFMTDFALGTFIYLANNNSSGTSIKAQGIELGEITSNGSHMFNVSAKFPDITLGEYQYVIVLCKPASVVFGYAELN